MSQQENIMNKKFTIGLIAAGLLVLSPMAGTKSWAEDPVPAPTDSDSAGRGAEVSEETLDRWQNLSEDQKEILRRRHARLKDMDPAQLEKIKQRYQRFKNLPPEAREKIKKNWERLQGLPPEKRAALRERFERWQNLSPDQKQKLRQRYQRWKTLSPEQREKLRRAREEWQDLPADQRKEFRQKYQQRIKQRLQDNTRQPQGEKTRRELPRRQQNPPSRSGSGSGASQSPR